MEQIIEKFKALRTAEKIIVITGFALFIDGFLPWYQVSVGPISVTANGWEAPGAIWSILAILIGTTMAGTIIFKHFARAGLPYAVQGFTWPKIYLGGGVAALAFVLIKYLNESSYLGFAFYVGLIAATALAVGGVLLFREETARY